MMAWSPQHQTSLFPDSVIISYYLTEEWRRLVEGAGFELLEQRLVRSELNVNPDARGWIETYARKR